MRYRIRTALVITMLAAMFSSLTIAEEWPHWRGPNHDGISAETGLQVKWDAVPPTVWQRQVGSAFSAFACVDGKIYTCGEQDGKQVLFCLDAQTGAVLWQKPFEKSYQDPQGGDGTRATPTIDDGRVYIQGGWGRMVCFEAKTGKELWSREFNTKPVWGYSGSILIEGDLAIAAGGDEDGPLVALDKKSGKTIWKCGQAPTGYATPYPFTWEGRRYVAGFLGKSIIIVDVKDGREVWSKPWETSWDVNAATPIFHNGYLFFSTGYRHGSIMLKLKRAGEKLIVDTVWEGKSVRAKFQTPVLYQGHLYTSDEVGLKCVEFASGEQKWSKRGITFGTVVIADGHLFVLTENGELLIAPATPTAFEPTTQVQILSGRCWTVPTLYPRTSITLATSIRCGALKLSQ